MQTWAAIPSFNVPDTRRKTLIESALVGYMVLLIPFIFGALPEYSLLNRILAWVVFVVGTWPTIKMLTETVRRVPILELALLNYAIFFSLPVFFQKEQPVYAGFIEVVPSLINEALLLTLLAIGGIVIGSSLMQGRLSREPALNLETSDKLLMRIGLGIAGIRVILFLGIVPISPLVARIADVLFSFDLALALLAVLYYRGVLSREWKYIALGVLGAAIVLGLSSGMTQGVLQPIVIWYLASWVTTGRLRLRFAALAVVIFFVLQPVKSEYRSQAWFGDATKISTVERATLFGSLAWLYWSDIITSGNTENITSDVQSSASRRLSLLLSTTRYIELTPEVYEHTRGESLMYMVYTWIPRAIWPSKPTASLANKEYPFRYGMQHPDNTSTTFGVGHVAETYINVGLLGLPFVFIGLGIMYMVPYLILGRYPTDSASIAIQIALSLDLMFVGSTVGIAFGSIVQQVLAQVLLFRILASRRIRPAVQGR